MTVIWTLATLVAISLQIDSTVGVRRFRSNLVLYSGYTSEHKRAVYSNSEPNEWKNLNTLVKVAGFKTKALLCGMGNGAWMVYPMADYQTNDEHSYVRLLIGDVCIAADAINSAQPLGPINKQFEGLLTFTSTYFGSEPKALNNESESADGIGSLISAPGVVEAYMVEGDGKKFCVMRPSGLIRAGICIMPDIETELGIKSAKVTVGCEGVGGDLKPSMDVMFDQMQTCFSRYGAFRIVSNYLTIPALSAICGGGGDDGAKLGFQMIVDAWKFRMNPRQQVELNPADIDLDRSDILTPMRMELLSDFFNIFKLGCNSVVPDEYFDMIRYIFMQHMKSIWNEAPQAMMDKNDTMKMWRYAHDFMQRCHAARAADPVVDVIPLVSCSASPSSESSKPTWEANVLDLFLEGDELDTVIEQVWIMLNYVAPYCSASSAIKDNLWADFVNFFRRQFLLPVLQQWLNPGRWQIYYNHMFNGYSLEAGKRLVISCAKHILRQTPMGDPVDRPSALVQEFMSLSKQRPAIPVPPMNAKSRAKRELASVRRKVRKTRPSVPKKFASARQMAEKPHGQHSKFGKARGARV